ncbi:MAG: PLDc N-terminal domain-containing protein [Rhodoglobus sp.]|nr:PLDc N-terminal domain-containing protein [Rhodoglobus sp.]
MDPITISLSTIGLIIFIITLVSIVGNPNHGAFGKFIWILVALFLSVLGSILWLLLGRGRVAKR